MTSGSAQKFVWGSMVDFQKISCNFGAAARRTAKRQDVVELNLAATDLKRAFGSGRPWESKVMYYSFEQNRSSWYKIADWQFLKLYGKSYEEFSVTWFS